MNKKEVAEIRRRVNPDKSNIQHIYGCYVNSQKEIISKFDESLGLLERTEQEKYISLLKKALSGSLGKNLVDLSFTTRQVTDGDEHKLLSALRKSELKDDELLDRFYNCVVQSLDMGDLNYLILIAFDSYDVPHFGKSGELEESTDVFRYILCSICPVKTGKPLLHYSPDDERFESLSLAQIVSSPEVGFMFPTFDDRSTNIYDALFYTRDTKGIHEDLINAIFKTEVPMPARQQKEAFGNVIRETLSNDCRFNVVQAVHEELKERIELHKESKDPEPLTVTYDDLADILEKNGMDADRKDSFISGCKERFGEDKDLSPDNIIDSRKFEICTESVKINVDPAYSSFIKTQVIDGRKYILIPADSGVEVNGIEIKI